MQVRFTSKPSALLVSVTAMKSYLKVEHTVDDDYITQLIKSAVSACEQYTNRCFLSRELEVVYNHPDVNDVFSVPYVPMLTDGDVTVEYSIDGTSTELSASNYTVNEVGGKIIIRTFPTTIGNIEFWKITYSAGVTDVADVEDSVIQAVYSIVADHYHNRGDGVRNMTSASQRLLNPLKNIVFING